MSNQENEKQTSVFFSQCAPLRALSVYPPVIPLCAAGEALGS